MPCHDVRNVPKPIHRRAGASSDDFTLYVVKPGIGYPIVEVDPALVLREHDGVLAPTTAAPKEVRVEVVDELRGELPRGCLGEGLRVDVRGHQTTALVHDVVPRFLEPLMERAQANPVSSLNVAQGLRVS